jgi:hypothetical protein
LILLLARRIPINIMKFRWLCPLLLVLISVCQPSVSRSDGAPLQVSEFPEPPQQQARWEVSANIFSSELVSATKTLFEQGLADPRGCDYREIDIHVGEVWRGDGGMIKTHGWVLPGAATSVV